MRGGTNDSDLWMKTFDMSRYRSYMPRITLRGAIVAGIMSKKVAGKKNILLVELGALAYGKLERG